MQPAAPGETERKRSCAATQPDARDSARLWVADRSGQGALGQAGEKHLALGLGDAVPERCAKSAGPGGVDADGGELDR